MTYPLTYVVIINWNGKRVLHKCLTTFFANTKSQNCRVVLVDNSSSDGSVEMLQDNFPQVKLIKNTKNMGFSIANNQGIKVALANDAQQVLLLNNDIEITDSKWLETLSSVLESDPKVGVVGCKLLYPDGRIQHVGGVIKLWGAYHRGEGEKDWGQYDKTEYVDYVTGAVLLIKSKIIREIGLLDEGFTPIYWEDSDWCLRARFHGYKIVYTPKPTLIHHCGVDTAKMGSPQKTFISRKNAIRFFLLNFQVKDIVKRIITLETKAALACIFSYNRNGTLPIALRKDAAIRVELFLNEWLPSVKNFKNIISLRRQRFVLGAKLNL